MDTDAHGSCPPLPVFNFHDNLVASSLSNAIGSLVEFLCSGNDDEVLSGPSVLLCTSAGKWNGSIPTCVDKNDITSSTLYVTTETTHSTTITADELEVDTVLIVLWITGGLLLITLSVLIGCILRAHKKRRRNRSERVPRAQGNPRHGGVNPTFSNYDEIWTWIPVLTDNDENCRNQPSACRRENGANQTNSELLRNLRLPTYTEAVRGATVVTSPSQNRTRSAHTVPSNQRNIVLNRQNVNQRQTTTQANNQRSTQVNVRESQNLRQSSRVPHVHRTVVNVRETSTGHCVGSGQNRNSALSNNPRSTEHHHYETIPADVISQSNTRTNHESNGRVHVTMSSGSALQQARDLVDQYSAHAQRPPPSAPALNEHSRVSRESDRHQSHTSRSNMNPPNENLRDITRSRVQLQYPQHPVRHDFRHNEGSRFEYYADNGLRVERNNAAHRTSEPPPPYSATREPSRHARDSSSGRLASGTSSGLAEASLYTGLECQYF